MDIDNKGGGTVGAHIRDQIRRRTQDKRLFLLDALALLLGFLFARTHVGFGSYPLGIALCACASDRVIIIALGGAIGALSLGEVGTLYSVLILRSQFCPSGEYLSSQMLWVHQQILAQRHPHQFWF